MDFLIGSAERLMIVVVKFPESLCIVQPLSIHVDLPVPDLDDLLLKRDHSFNEILFGVDRVFEHHDIAPFNRLEPVNEFIHE